MNTSDLIYDWNKNFPPGLKPPGPVLLNDESLRDGLQSPSVRDPSISEKIEILHLMEALGINSLDLGLPGAGPRAVEAVTALAREIAAHKMKIQRQLRRAHARKRYSSDRRDRAEDRPAHRGRDIHRLQPDSPFHRRLDRRLPAEDDRESREVRGVARARCHVRHRRYEPLRSGNGEAPVYDARSSAARGRSAFATLLGMPRRWARWPWCDS